MKKDIFSSMEGFRSFRCRGNLPRTAAVYFGHGYDAGIALFDGFGKQLGSQEIKIQQGRTNCTSDTKQEEAH